MVACEPSSAHPGLQFRLWSYPARRTGKLRIFFDGRYPAVEFLCPVANDVNGIHSRQWQLNQKSRSADGGVPDYNRPVQFSAVLAGISDLFPDVMVVFQGTCGVVLAKFFPDCSVANPFYFGTLFYIFDGNGFFSGRTPFYRNFFDASFLVNANYL